MTVSLWVCYSEQPLFTNFTCVYVCLHAKLPKLWQLYSSQLIFFSNTGISHHPVSLYSFRMFCRDTHISHCCKNIHASDTVTEISTGRLPWSSLKTWKTSFKVSSEYQGCHPDDLFVSVDAIWIIFPLYYVVYVLNILICYYDIHEITMVTIW